MEELRAHWPIGKFPLLVDGERALFEATIIIEYLDRLAPEPPLIPADPDAELTVRSEERRVGKECVIRVDLGGRRIIKKKKTALTKIQSDVSRQPYDSSQLPLD